MLEEKPPLNELKPQDAHFYFDDKKAIQIEPEKDGQLIDRVKLLTALDQSIKTLNSRPMINLKEAAPNVSAAQLSQRKEELFALVKKPITLTYEGRKWNLKLLDHIEAIGFENRVSYNLHGSNSDATLPSSQEQIKSNASTSLTATAEIFINPEKMNDFLEKEIISKIDKPTTGVKISKGENEKILIDGKGQNGLAVTKRICLPASI